ncbi:MAG: hypothetical protein ACXW3D_00585 [Caulobacteraceae bacterium]
MSSATLAQTPPPAPPSCSAPEYRQLDFWVGDWDASFDLGAGKTGHAVNHITRDEYGACVIAEHFYQPDIDYRGHSVSMFDRQSKQWRQTWVDNQGSYIALAGGPVTGQKHIFELNTIRNADTAKFTRMIWEDVTPDSFTWRWQQRKAETDPWADSWVIHYTRKKG